MSSRIVIFQNPKLKDLVTVDLVHKDSDESFNVRQQIISRCRRLILLNESYLASPLLSNNVSPGIRVVLQRDHLDGLYALSKAMHLTVSKECDVTLGDFRECLNFSILTRISPLWNRVERVFIPGNNFLLQTGNLRFVEINANVTEKETRLTLMPGACRLRHMTLYDIFDRNSIQTAEEVAHLVSSPKRILPPVPCYVLPSMKMGHIVQVFLKLNSSTGIKNFDEMRNFWLDQYGYDLPRDIGDSMIYVSVQFWNNGPLLTYPILCVRPQPLIRLPRYFTTTVIENFLSDLRKQFGERGLCGIPFRFKYPALMCPTQTINFTAGQFAQPARGREPNMAPCSPDENLLQEREVAAPITQNLNVAIYGPMATLPVLAAQAENVANSVSSSTAANNANSSAISNLPSQRIIPRFTAVKRPLVPAVSSTAKPVAATLKSASGHKVLSSSSGRLHQHHHRNDFPMTLSTFPASAHQLQSSSSSRGLHQHHNDVPVTSSTSSLFPASVERQSVLDQRPIKQSGSFPITSSNNYGGKLNVKTVAASDNQVLEASVADDLELGAHECVQEPPRLYPELQAKPAPQIFLPPPVPNCYTANKRPLDLSMKKGTPGDDETTPTKSKAPVFDEEAFNELIATGNIYKATIAEMRAYSRLKGIPYRSRDRKMELIINIMKHLNINPISVTLTAHGMELSKNNSTVSKKVAPVVHSIRVSPPSSKLLKKHQQRQSFVLGSRFGSISGGAMDTTSGLDFSAISGSAFDPVTGLDLSPVTGLEFDGDMCGGGVDDVTSGEKMDVSGLVQQQEKDQEEEMQRDDTSTVPENNAPDTSGYGRFTGNVFLDVSAVNGRGFVPLVPLNDLERSPSKDRL